MIAALDFPTWGEIERDLDRADGPFQVRPSRMGYVWLVEDTRTGVFRSSGFTEAEAQARADTLNRSAL